MPDRRFPPPWTVEDNGAAFIVKDRAGRDALRRSSRGHAAMSGVEGGKADITKKMPDVCL
jgi:hypothetical protein